MSEIIHTTQGRMLDLDTPEGCYGYVAEHLGLTGADSKTFSCLEKLLKQCNRPNYQEKKDSNNEIR